MNQTTKNWHIKITLETEKFLADYCTTKKKSSTFAVAFELRER